MLLVSSNTALHPYPAYPLGMAMVAAALERAGHEVRQFDMLQQGESLERFREVVREFQPGLIGISIRNVDNTNLLKEQRYVATAQALVAAAREVTQGADRARRLRLLAAAGRDPGRDRRRLRDRGRGRAGDREPGGAPGPARTPPPRG